MAITYPKEISFRTNGEKLLYDQILKDLSNEWFVFYETIIQGREPDFILFNQSYGIVIIEVKDYKNETIVSFNPHTWKINSNGEIIKVTSPIKQVLNYRNLLMEYLSSFDFLTDHETKRLIFPIHTMCAFPNLTQEAAESRSLDNLFTDYNILFNDDLYNIESFYIKIDQSKKRLFTPSSYETNIVEKLLNIIYPQSKVALNRESATYKANSINNTEIQIEKFSSVIEEILFIIDEVVNKINTSNIRFNEILIVTNDHRLGRYNAYKYKEKLIEQARFKNLPINGSNGIKFMSYEQLIDNFNLLFELKKICLVDFNCTPNKIQQYFLENIDKDRTMITTNKVI